MDESSRVLVGGRVYFGVDALLFRRGAERVQSRIDSSRDATATVTVQTLAADFAIEQTQACHLLRLLVRDKLLEPTSSAGAYSMTKRFRSYAAARVLPPLRRTEAKQLMDRILALASDINNGWERNPVRIAAIAVSGSYMLDSEHVPKIDVWVQLDRRVMSAAHWRSRLSKSQGADEIRAAMSALSPFIAVRLVTDLSPVERPFFIAFDAASTISDPSGPITVLRERVFALGRRATGNS